MKVGFVGLSHLGLTSGAALASRGFDVLGFDPDGELVQRLNSGVFPIHEPGFKEAIAASGKRIQFSSSVSDLKSCDAVYLSLDIKTDEKNQSDLGPLQKLISKVVAEVSSRAVVVLLSQVPPGFSRGIAEKFGADRFFYQVETLIFGQAMERALKPERYIVGCADPLKPLPEAFEMILALPNCPILRMRYESAELSKIAINLYLVSSVSVTNTLAEVCEKIGAEWKEIVPALRLDRRIGPYAYLSAGLGIAGGNLERDVVTLCTLAEDNGTDASVVKSWIAYNRQRAEWAQKTLYSNVLSARPSAKIGIWGLAYKQDTKSTKNSASIALIENLKGHSVRAYDPQVQLGDNVFPQLTQVRSPLEASKGVDVLLVMTPWKEFGSQSLSEVKASMGGEVVIDPYGVFNKKECVDLGLKYFTLGSKP